MVNVVHLDNRQLQRIERKLDENTKAINRLAEAVEGLPEQFLEFARKARQAEREELLTLFETPSSEGS